jgi:hypothetical protein
METCQKPQVRTFDSEGQQKINAWEHYYKSSKHIWQ